MSAQRHAEETESVYTEFDISDHLERQRDVSQFIRDDDPEHEKIAQLDETLDEVPKIPDWLDESLAGLGIREVESA